MNAFKISVKFKILIIVLVVSSGSFIVYNSQYKQIMPIYRNRIMAQGREISVSGYDIYLDGRKLSEVERFIRKRDYLPYVNLYILTKTDPLFASEYLNNEQFSDSIYSLKEDYEKIKKNINLPKDQEFMPIKFLEQLSVVFRANSDYLDVPNQENAKTLLSEYEKTLVQYRSDIDLLMKTYASYYPEETLQPFSPFDAETTNKVIIDDYKFALENTIFLQKEIVARKEMLEGHLLRLDSYNKKPVKDYAKPSSPEFVEKDLLQVDSQYINSLRGPYLVRTSCFLENNKEKYFYVYDRRIYGKTVLMPKQADENYYFINNDNMDNLQEGLVPAQEGTTYRCNDLTYQIELLAIDEFEQRFGVDRVSARDEFVRLSKVSKVLSDLKLFEDKYYNEKYKSYSNLESLKNLYFNTYLEAAGEDKASEDLRKNLLERYLFLETRHSGLEKIFSTSFYLSYINHMNEGGANIASNGGYYGVRAAYGVTLFEFSPTVWRKSEKMTYLSGKHSNKGLVLFSDIKSKLDNFQIMSINNKKTPFQAKVDMN